MTDVEGLECQLSDLNLSMHEVCIMLKGINENLSEMNRDIHDLVIVLDNK